MRKTLISLRMLLVLMLVSLVKTRLYSITSFTVRPLSTTAIKDLKLVGIARGSGYELISFQLTKVRHYTKYSLQAFDSAFLLVCAFVSQSLTYD